MLRGGTVKREMKVMDLVLLVFFFVLIPLISVCLIHVERWQASNTKTVRKPPK